MTINIRKSFVLVSTMITVFASTVLAFPNTASAELINCSTFGNNTNCYGSSLGSVNCNSFGSTTSCYTSGGTRYTQSSPLLLQGELDLFKIREEARVAEAKKDNEYKKQILLWLIAQRVSSHFSTVFGRAITGAEINYWGNRVLDEAFSDTELKNKMIYYKSLGKTMGGGATVVNATMAKDVLSNKDVPAVVERLFLQVYSRKIMPSESIYWKNRARSDKQTESTLKGVMLYHKQKGIKH